MSDKSGKIEKTALFEQLRIASELYVLMSVCTRTFFCGGMCIHCMYQGAICGLPSGDV